MAGALFLVGAGVYSYLWPEDIISIETQPPASVGPGAPVIPFKPPEDALVAGITNPFSTGNLIGLDVFDPNKNVVGKITDLVLDRHGTAQGIVVGLGGYWLTKKYVVIPFKDFSWDYMSAAGNPKALIIERGTVPYGRDELRAARPIGDPLVPVDPKKPGSE